MTSYKIEKQLGILSRSGSMRLELNLISWNDNPPCYDLRVWINSRPEGWLPAKGIILKAKEARILAELLQKALEPKEPPAAMQAEKALQKAENGDFTEPTIICPGN